MDDPAYPPSVKRRHAGAFWAASVLALLIRDSAYRLYRKSQ